MVDLTNLKPLYLDGEIYSDKANELDEEITAFLSPIFRTLVEQNYSIRQAAHLMIGVVNRLEGEVVLTRNLDEHRKKQPRLKFSEGGK